MAADKKYFYPFHRPMAIPSRRWWSAARWLRSCRELRDKLSPDLRKVTRTCRWRSPGWCRCRSSRKSKGRCWCWTWIRWRPWCSSPFASTRWCSDRKRRWKMDRSWRWHRSWRVWSPIRSSWAIIACSCLATLSGKTCSWINDWRAIYPFCSACTRECSRHSLLTLSRFVTRCLSRRLPFQTRYVLRLQQLSQVSHLHVIGQAVVRDQLDDVVEGGLDVRHRFRSVHLKEGLVADGHHLDDPPVFQKLIADAAQVTLTLAKRKWLQRSAYRITGMLVPPSTMVEMRGSNRTFVSVYLLF